MAKAAISAKVDNNLLSHTDKLAKIFKMPRNQALEEGLRLWTKVKERELLARQMQEASSLVRKESLKNAKEWERALNDGIEDK